MSQKRSTFLNYDLKPKTEGQRRYIQTLERSLVTFCDGPAGTGKTHISTCYAMELLRQGSASVTYVKDLGSAPVDVQKIIICRPIVSSGREIGYLPGTMEEKVSPYLMPILDELLYCFDKQHLTKLMKEGAIEICPLHLMRGRNFHRSFIVCDEAQNATYAELRLLLTRLGRNSRMCISGDTTQTDITDSAFSEIAGKLEQHDLIGRVSLTSADIVRHKLIADIERLLA